MFNIPADMHFEIAYKWVIYLLPLPLLFFILLPPLRKRRSALLAPFFWRAADVSGRRPKRRAWITRKNLLAWIVLSAVWVCLLAAASSPRYVGKPGKKTKTVRSFLIATDISYSMATTDWIVDGRRTTRWNAVKSIMKSFVRDRKSDQVGLVMFGTNAYLQSPFTTDLETVSWLMDQTEVGMAGQMTSIGDAIAYGIKVFKEDTIKQKVMLLLTDGIDAGNDILPLDAAQAARRDSITIYTLGIGQARGSGGYDLDEKTLKNIASATGGIYFNAMNEGQLKRVYTTLDKLQPIKYDEDTYKPVVLLYMYPLAAAIGLALVYQLLNGIFHLFRRRAI
ncbi:VWA domain-containing protein [Pedobacter sp. HMF7647]|uniref:VWA domain-containing protein n=1 Tax=Hufsiella arboris TaxID=2695275 RepID=A0A7K1YF70_9SPHI|nr:VWA domain-containing protein [Hufsiella arboris]MXV53245.1 VWA domain-containing protein [Hufsiella arboris]